MSVDMDKNVSATTSAMSAAYAVPRVNLLPDEIVAERRLRRTQLALGGVVLGTVGAVAVGFVVAAASAAAAQDDLDVATATTTRLTAEQAEYAEVPLVVGQVQAAQEARATAMGADVLWYEYLGHLSASYPKDVWLRDLTVTANAPGQVAGTPADQVAKIDFNGTGTQHTGTADWLDVLEATPGLADPMYSESARTDIDGTVVVDFTTSVSVTRDALSLRYEIKAS
jgi:Tfp pilus assembly protein PilN